MPEVLAQVDRDQAVWSDWVRGDSQAAIADRRGVSRQAVSQAVRRYSASIPTEDKTAHRERALARLEELYAFHRDRAATSTRSAAIVRQVVMDEARLLGLVTSKVEHAGGVDVSHTWVPGPTLDELLERWRAEGWLRPTVELTRTDQAP
jgi:transposase